MAAPILRRLAALVLLVLAFGSPAMAVQPQEMLKDPVLEQRARALSAGLRCMVCQNESIDESHAPLARDIRVLVRERLTAGDTDAEVIDFLVARYGNFVLLKPPFEVSTILLWVTPFAVLVLGAAGACLALRRRRASGTGVVALNEVERARLEEVLKR
jgi:cytochrome c-type biogenesis protein CcmH